MRPARCSPRRLPKYINEKLGGKANVVILSHDSMEFLAPRFAAMRDIVQDHVGRHHRRRYLADNPVNKEGGFATMSTILQAHPDVDVVLGADTVVLGALAAAGSRRQGTPDQFLGGIDGGAGSGRRDQEGAMAL